MTEDSQSPKIHSDFASHKHPSSGSSSTRGPLARGSIIDIAARDARRLKTVFAVMIRHGFGELLLRSPLSRTLINRTDVTTSKQTSQPLPAAKRLKNLLEDLGPTFVKFGQVLSMRSDLLPQEFVEALQSLQDKARPIPYADIETEIKRGLGGNPTELFASFDPTPIGSASISQAHVAQTHEGDKVVVKVQRPGVVDIMRGDLDLLYLLAKILEASIEEMRIWAPSEVVSHFEKALLKELNFLDELENLKIAKSLSPDDSKIHIPRGFPKLSCATVLTMEFFEGQPLRCLEPDNARTHATIENLVDSFLKQILIDGFFHGDPHSGNILVNSEGRLCFIDYGLVGTLDDHQRLDIINLILGVMIRDNSTIARTLLKMGAPTTRVNISELKVLVGRVLATHFDSGLSMSQINSHALVTEFLEAANYFKIRLASEYVILSKASATIEGIVRRLHPDLDLAKIGRPYVDQFIAKKFATKNLVTESLGGILGLRSFLGQLPGQVEQILHDAGGGYTQVRMVAPEIEAIAPILHQLGGRLVLGLFATSMSVGAAMLLVINQPNQLQIAATILLTLMATSSWITLFGWHIFGRGKPIKMHTLLQFFRR